MSGAKGKELLGDIAAKMASVLRAKGGMTAERAHEIAADVVDMLRKDLGGQLFYLPKGTALDIESRDIAMWRDFNGRNHEELSRKYNLAIPKVYQRLKAVRAAMIAREQSDLFTG